MEILQMPRRQLYRTMDNLISLLEWNLRQLREITHENSAQLRNHVIRHNLDVFVDNTSLLLINVQRLDRGNLTQEEFIRALHILVDVNMYVQQNKNMVIEIALD